MDIMSIHSLHMTLERRNKGSISMLLLFVLFLFQQPSLGAGWNLPSAEHPAAIGQYQTSHHISSSCHDKSQNKDFHFLAADTFITIPFSTQAIAVDRIGDVLDFLPVTFHLVYSQYTSTYL